MMDFLRRLAPPRENDPTRATAVLPSRFATEHPLRMTAPPVPPDSHVDEDATLTRDARRATARISEPRGQRSAAINKHYSGSELEPLENELLGDDLEEVASNLHRSGAVDAPSAIGDVDANAIRKQRNADSKRPGTLDAHPYRFAPALSAAHGAQGMATARSLPTVAAPLSQAMLAQRAHQPHEPSEVIHVSIGRIEVVTNTAPAPAARRTSKPRAGTVTLADYLRGSSGSRR